MSSNGPNNTVTALDFESTSGLLIASPAGRFVTSPTSGRTKFQVGNRPTAEVPTQAVNQESKSKTNKKCNM